MLIAILLLYLIILSCSSFAAYPVTIHAAIATISSIDKPLLAIAATITGAIIGFMAALVTNIRSVRAQERIAKASLIQKLHENASTHADIVQWLEERHDEINDIGRKSVKTGNSSKTPTKGEKQKLREFLRFLEMLMLIVESGVVKPGDVFPLFAFRIFLAMNNEYVRTQFLADPTGMHPRRSFCTLFALHHRLLQYFRAKYESNFAAVLNEIHVDAATDISAQCYYASGVRNYVLHRRKPLTPSGKPIIDQSIYSRPGWPEIDEPEIPPTDGIDAARRWLIDFWRGFWYTDDGR